MTKTDYLAEILSSIDALATRGKLTRSKAFASWFAINFFNHDEDEALEAAASDGGNDQGIDLIFADPASEEIVILQAHCPENFTKKTGKNKWDALVASQAFVNNPESLEKVGRPDLKELIERVKSENPEYPFAFGLITLGLHSQEIEDSVSAHNDNEEEVEFFYASQEEIISRYKVLVSSEAGIANGSLKLTGGYVNDSGDYGKALIGSVSAEELRRLHKAHSNDLFAGNIRLFLGARKGGINEQIIKTAKDQPGKFWALNNGITIVADTAEPNTGDDGSVTINLTRFSIVNGCQTTSSLVQAKADKSAKVLVRVIAAKAAIRSDIVRYNNSQNAVRIWSVRSADSLQQNLRADFKKIGIDYAPKQEGSRKKKDLKIIELDKVTQYIAASHNEFLIPAIANKGSLFDQPYQKIFHKGISAEDVFINWVIGNMADEERQSLLGALDSDPNAGLLGVTRTC